MGPIQVAMRPDDGGSVRRVWRETVGWSACTLLLAVVVCVSALIAGESSLLPDAIRWWGGAAIAFAALGAPIFIWGIVRVGISRARAIGLLVDVPRGLSFCVVRKEVTATAIRSLTSESDERKVPLDMSVIADRSGLSLFGGGVLEPRLVWKESWKSIVSISRAGSAIGSGRGVAIEVVHDGLVTKIEFSVVGRGFGGLGAPRATALDSLIDSMNLLRRPASTAPDPGTP
ncbi:hypothetical protein [Agromyces bracchium]|uniref:Uncharacterized protein n=1 Tax=Agromyces bracchium TaxID=88376 RepID=A0A6I3MAW3_9MICO|nr:hypothetical protein [Agromyces bracchium]MTH70484.1 hypothetical protein [Agromyces bracchium]